MTSTRELQFLRGAQRRNAVLRVWRRFMERLTGIGDRFLRRLVWGGDFWSRYGDVWRANRIAEGIPADQVERLWPKDPS